MLYNLAITLQRRDPGTERTLIKASSAAMRLQWAINRLALRYLRNMCDQAGGLQHGYHWLNLAGSTAPCVRSGLRCRALIKVFITITISAV
jgi:hypothetical protein